MDGELRDATLIAINAGAEWVEVMSPVRCHLGHSKKKMGTLKCQCGWSQPPGDAELEGR